MIGRRQLPVASPIDPRAVVRAFGDALVGREGLQASAQALIKDRFTAPAALLTDSGTSALVLALRAAVGAGGTVAYPGYACVDLAAAARYAGVKVRLYDIDPETLSPDLESARRVLERGVDAIVVAHLFGYAADVPGVRVLAGAAGVPVIEDAAQGAGGELLGQRLGSLGDLTVLSFGRGKGLCAGGGGALLGRGLWESKVEQMNVEPSGRGLGAVGKTAVQWALGRPSVFALPSMIPWLRLGQMVYHPASEPTGLPQSAASLLHSAIALEADDLVGRHRVADHLGALVAGARCGQVRVARPLANSNPGYLRFAVRDATGRRAPDAAMGIVQPYPRTLAEQDELRSVLVSGEPDTPGARDLRQFLFALPTHRNVGEKDIVSIARWLDSTPQ